MRIRPAPDDALERVAIRLNLVPLPAAYVLYGMTAGRVLGTAQRLGMFTQLLKGPATAGRLAEELSLQVAGTRLLCESLAGLGILEQDGHTFALAKRARKWLDPASDTYIGTWLEHTATYWEWYGDLERIVRDGGSFEIHREPAEDEEYWRVYITGQYEIARLSAAEVAKAIRLSQKPTALLDVAGAHGWFSAELCRRHETLKATVVDLPGSARVGREIIAKAGMSDRVEHREGDMFEADLGGPYDGALVFDIIHHLSGEQIVTLFRRVRERIKPGGTLAVLDMFRVDAKRQRASAAALGLLFHLTSGADLHTPSELTGYMREAGFSAPKRTKIRRIPDQDLYQAQAEVRPLVPRRAAERSRAPCTRLNSGSGTMPKTNVAAPAMIATRTTSGWGLVAAGEACGQRPAAGRRAAARARGESRRRAPGPGSTARAPWRGR